MQSRIILFLLFSIAVMGAALAEDKTPAQPYDTIEPRPTSSSDKIEVIEFFWYGCPHCFDLEPYLTRWLATKPEDVVFLRIPAVLGNSWIHYARVYLAAEKLGVVDKLHTPLFNGIHEQRTPLNDGDKLGKFLKELGIDKDRFFEAYSSPEVETKLKNAYVMGKDYGLTGVPTIIINGKYRTSSTQAGSNEKLIEVINDLIARERAVKSSQ